MAECILICALIALTAIASIGSTGVFVKNQFEKSGNTLSLANHSSHELGNYNKKDKKRGK